MQYTNKSMDYKITIGYSNNRCIYVVLCFINRILLLLVPSVIFKMGFDFADDVYE